MVTIETGAAETVELFVAVGIGAAVCLHVALGLIAVTDALPIRHRVSPVALTVEACTLVDAFRVGRTSVAASSALIFVTAVKTVTTKPRGAHTLVPVTQILTNRVHTTLGITQSTLIRVTYGHSDLRSRWGSRSCCSCIDLQDQASTLGGLSCAEIGSWSCGW